MREREDTMANTEYHQGWTDAIQHLQDKMLGQMAVAYEEGASAKDLVLGTELFLYESNREGREIGDRVIGVEMIPSEVLPGEFIASWKIAK